MSTEQREQEGKIVSKKHLARQEKERRQRKWLLISIITLVVAVILVITYGILDKTVLQSKKAVAKVNSTVINVDQFQKRVKYERYALTQTYLQYATSYFATYFQSQLLQVQNQLDDYIQFGSDTLDSMVEEELVVQKAQELGITVTEDEINKELEENFGYYANGTPTTAPTLEYKPTSTYSPAQLAIITLTPTATESPTATVEAPTATLEITDEVETTESAATEATATETQMPTSTPTLEVTEVPTESGPTPTPTEYTYDGYQNLYSTMISSISTETSFGDTEIRNYVRNIIYSRKLYEYLTKDVEREQEMVWARHILVSTEEDAQTVLEKLNSGEDWAALALEYSQDTSNSSNGGDIGWFTSGQMVQEFEAASWPMKIGEISQPVKTEFGYHIIQVLGHEVRQLSESEMSTFKNTIYQKFIDDAKTSATIKKFDVWAEVVPTTPTIPSDYRVDTSGSN